MVCIVILLGILVPVYAQTQPRLNWELISKTLADTRLKDFFYKKGSLYNEAEGIIESEEVPVAMFCASKDSTNKGLAFVLMFEKPALFEQDNLIKESKAYVYQDRKCYFRETESIQTLYMYFESLGWVVSISFRKTALHNQSFIEHLFDELKPESIIEKGFK